MEFVVQPGDTPTSLAPRLEDAGIIASQRAFLYEARQDDLSPKLNAGRFSLALNLTPSGVVDGPRQQPDREPGGPGHLPRGPAAEQMTAKLQTIPGTDVDPKAFYDLVMKPTDALLGDYPWLLDETSGPRARRSRASSTRRPTRSRTGDENPTTADDLVRMMLDAFYDRVGPDRLKVPDKRGLTFYEELTLASIVEREAQVDEERPLIAGVYQNRLNPKKWPTGLLQSDPTIFYVNDTLQLDAMKFNQWQTYVFWDKLKEQLPVPAAREPGRATTPTRARACRPGRSRRRRSPPSTPRSHPNTKDGYLFFIAKGDGSGTSAFAKTHAEHDQNVAKYGKD